MSGSSAVIKLFVHREYEICISSTGVMLCKTQLNTKPGHNRPVNETPSGWRFAGGRIVARFNVLTG